MSRLPPVPATTPLQRFLGHTATLARTLATESGPPSLDLLIEENVAQQVRNLLESDIIKQVSAAESAEMGTWAYAESLSPERN